MRNGYMTVYLALVTGLLLSLMLTIIEGVRMHTIRTQTECVMDMAMDSALAEYHREMLEQYDLFFIDLSYGNGAPSYANAEGHIRNYMNMNFRPFAVSDIPLGKDLTGMAAGEVRILQASLAADGDGAVLKRQAVDYMKDRWGLDYLSRAAMHAEILRGNGLLDSDVEEWREETEREVKEAIARKREEEEEDWEGRDVELPSDVVDQVRGEGILALAARGPESISRTHIPVDTLFSHRSHRMEGTGLPDGKAEPSGIAEICLFRDYVMEKCGFYGKEKERCGFSYQVEYILEGRENDLENIRSVADKILLIREAANVSYLLGDGTKRGEAGETALLLTSILGLPELADAVEVLILFAWAYAESVKDLRMLFDGEKVPVLKDAGSWNTPYSQLLTFRGHLSEYSGGQEGLSYEEYLEAFLYLQAEDITTRRLMDVMEADIRMMPGNGGFRIDGCMDAMTARADVSSGYGYQYQITRSYGYE